MMISSKSLREASDSKSASTHEGEGLKAASKLSKKN
jgi:hypothetical protein